MSTTDFVSPFPKEQKVFIALVILTIILAYLMAIVLYLRDKGQMRSRTQDPGGGELRLILAHMIPSDPSGVSRQMPGDEDKGPRLRGQADRAL